MTENCLDKIPYAVLLDWASLARLEDLPGRKEEQRSWTMSDPAPGFVPCASYLILLRSLEGACNGLPQTDGDVGFREADLLDQSCPLEASEPSPALFPGTAVCGPDSWGRGNATAVMKTQLFSSKNIRPLLIFIGWARAPMLSCRSTCQHLLPLCPVAGPGLCRISGVLKIDPTASQEGRHAS